MGTGPDGEKPFGRRRNLEVVFQRDPPENRHGVHAHMPAAGMRRSAHRRRADSRRRRAVALRSGGSMPRSGRLSTSVASFSRQPIFRRRTSAAARNCRYRRRPVEISTWNIARPEWIWIASGAAAASRHAARTMAARASERRPSTSSIEPHIFMPEGIFFMSMLPPESSAPAGPCAPTPSTSSETFTLPAFSNSSVTGTFSPCLSGLLRSNSIR